ncbi:MAG: sensor histidine kinase [Mariniphaga sp.]
MGTKVNFEIRITLIYLILGVLWILLSDTIVKFLVADLDRYTQLQSFKGIVFVLLSSGVIFFIARHYRSQQQEIKKHLIKARKKAEDSEKLKTAFLANLSHEIRTPMNGILGFVSLLEESDFQRDEHQEYMEYLKVSSERMLDTIGDIIEISQIESNQSQVQMTEFHPGMLIDYLYEQYRPAVEMKGLKFKLNKKLPDNHFLLKTDERKLASILKNFIKNAIKFSEKGTVELGSFLEDRRIVFYVKDHGIGIPQKDQKKIFDRFIQGDTNLTRPYEGSGLGLSIAKAYASLLGGRIQLESEEGKGSTFWFSMPHV